MMATNLQLYIYTLDEYKRFSSFLPVNVGISLIDDYSEGDYIGIQVRLMLLRKYFSSGKKLENVCIKRIIAETAASFPEAKDELDELLQKFEETESQHIEHLLSDGTKLNIYTTIEDSVYGLYLHADEERIINLKKTNEALRFVCIKKYVLDVESIVFKLYDILKRLGIEPDFEADTSRAPMLFLGNTNSHSTKQSIERSPYWKNIYGHDASDDDLNSIYKNLTSEEIEILWLCHSFTHELIKSPLPIQILKKYIHPFARNGWGDFTKAQTFFNSIPNPGISTKVRYNDAKDTAYVRIFPNVEEAFYLDSLHLFSGIYEFALGKWLGKWKIFSLGNHIDSVYKK